jgi:hypothetical protein
MSWRNSAAPWPVSTTLVTFYFFYTMLFRGQDFFVSFALRRQLACGCFSLLPYRFLSNFKTEKYGPSALENSRQTKAIHRAGRFLGIAGHSCLCFQVHSICVIDLA